VPRESPAKIMRLTGKPLEDTWWTRDLPVLDAVVGLLDNPGSFMATVREIPRT
jgi:hypothetical protein